MTTTDKKLYEHRKKLKVEIQKHRYVSFVFRSGGRRVKRAGPSIPVSCRRSRVQHKSPNIAEAPDSEQKAPDMQHNFPNKRVLAPSWLGNISHQKPGPKFSIILHTSKQIVRKMGPRSPLELSGGPPGAVSQRRSSRDNERVRLMGVYSQFGM